MRALTFCLTLGIVICAPAQPQQDRPKKVLTPDQIAYQAQMKTYSAERARLVSAANSAYTAEMARENAPTCPKAVSTYDSVMCLSKEGDITDANYQAFTSALRAMLALPAPQMPGVNTPAIGPSGREATPATNTAAFDTAESAWHTYAIAECSAVDTFWRGGTIVNSMVGECNLRLARARLHELNDAYDMPLHH